MTIDAETGLIQWTPNEGQQNSQSSIIIEVRDAHGYSARQNYSISVSTTAAPASNQSPEITSQPIFAAAVGQSYQYQVTARDPEGAALTYALQDAPQGMTIDPLTGLIQWTPSADEVGTYTVSVLAQDAQGAVAGQSFKVNSILNHAPTLLSQAITQAAVGQSYQYDLKAIDTDGDSLTYSLVQGPEGLTIDALGRVRWMPTTSNIGTTSIVLGVTDSRGATIQQSYDLSVIADIQAPKVSVIASQTTANIGDSVTFRVNATDNLRVAGRTLNVNGAPVVLDAYGQATVTLNQAGAISAIATAVDEAGNSGQATMSVQVIDPTNAHSPDISLDLSNIPTGVITEPVDILGSVTDPDNDLVEYKLEVTRIGSDQFTTVYDRTDSQGINSVNGVLGKFDPSLLENDTYTLRLTAVDRIGNISIVEDTISVAGDLKLGNFRLSFTDLSIPVTGIPDYIDAYL